MGVKHLETFMKKNVPDGVSTVSLNEECAMFQSTTGKRPTLVIDLMSIHNKINSDKIVELCGGRHLQYRKTLEGLFEKLSLIADLVFYEDGPTLGIKSDECSRRRNEKYLKSIKIIDKVNQGYSLSAIVESNSRDLTWMQTCLHLLEEMAKKYGKLIVAVTRECDSEIARFACNNPATLAIMADDTDFLIFKGNWRYFSFKSIDENKLTTKEYNRVALRKCLNLTDDQMKTLSTLAGNDIIELVDVEKFHERLHCKPWNKFHQLAQFIRERLPKERNALIGAIAENIFGSKLKVWKDLVEASLDLYKTEFEINDYSESDPILHLCIQKYNDFCFKILRELPESFSLVYYDMRDDPVDSFVESILNIFAKQIGVLLQHKYADSPDGIQIATTSKVSHKDDYMKLHVSPIYPEQQVPDLMELLNRQDFPDHDELRFSLLKWMVSDKLLETHDLRAIPKNYLLDVVTLCFMVDKKLLTVVEADLILFTIKKVELGSTHDDIQLPNDVVVPRAFKLSFLFKKVSNSIQRCFEVVGFKDTLMKIVNFDGVLFHIAYSAYINLNFNPSEKLKDIEKYRLYK